MKKYVVYYESHIFGTSFIHIFANDAEEAIAFVKRDGIAYSSGPVYPDRITGVREVLPEPDPCDECGHVRCVCAEREADIYTTESAEHREYREATAHLFRG